MEFYSYLLRLVCVVLVLPFSRTALGARLSPHECAAHGAQRCFTVTIREEPSSYGTRDASFEVLTAPALTRPAKDLPIFVVEALGEAGTSAATEGLMQSLEPLNRTHDLVFVDQRGVSGSLVLRCDSSRHSNALAVFARSFYNTGTMRVCGDLWKRKIDLSRLNARTFATDLEAVRKGLGYHRVELVGYFYGTRIVEEYLRRFGTNAAAALLIDIAVPGVSIFETQQSAQARALERVKDGCLANAECNTHFPHLSHDYGQLKRRLLAGSPFSADISHDGQSEHVVVSANIVRNWLEAMALRVNTAPTVPGSIHGLSGNDSAAVVLSILSSRRAIWETLPLGEIVAVRCNEDEGVLASEAGSRSDALRELDAACEVWPHTELHSAPFKSSVPILGVTADDSIVAPAGSVQLMFSSLSEARLIVLPARARAADYDWDLCLKPLSVAFLDGLNPQNVDASCVRRLKEPEFSGV